jgi:hypothetical protein
MPHKITLPSGVAPASRGFNSASRRISAPRSPLGRRAFPTRLCAITRQLQIAIHPFHIVFPAFSIYSGRPPNRHRLKMLVHAPAFVNQHFKKSRNNSLCLEMVPVRVFLVFRGLLSAPSKESGVNREIHAVIIVRKI